MPVDPYSVRVRRVLRTRCLRVLGVVAVGALATTMLAPAAQADDSLDLTATSTTTTTVPPNTTTSLAGLGVTDIDPSQSLVDITLSTDVGTLAITTTTNLTLAFGNHWSGDSSISFTGTADDANVGLATTTLTTGDNGGSTAHVEITAVQNEPGYVYSPSNGHFYQYVADEGVLQTDAVTGAAARSFLGQAGYLASIPTISVNDLISHRIEGATNVWMGAESVDTPGDPVQRTWEWRYGPLQGDPISYCSNFTDTCDFVDNDGLYSSWQYREPNNSGTTDEGSAHSGEWVAVTNYGGEAGLWNDFPPDIGDQAEGYLVEYGNLAHGVDEIGFRGLVTESSDVQIADATTSSTPDAPTGLSGTGGDRTLTLSWAAPELGRTAGADVVTYAVSLDDGETWTQVPTSGTTRLQTTLRGVRKDVTYPVRVRAADLGGTGPASPRLDVTIPQWFRDRVSPAVRAQEVPVPRHPKRYHGPRRHTVATARARDGRPAFRAAALDGRQLQSGEAVSLLSGAMFRYNKTTLLPAGRRALRATVDSLTYVQAVTCEGYADYGGRTTWERTLSKRRATAVCGALRDDGADVTTSRVSYGSSRPVLVGGNRAHRAANRRVVILITRG